MILTVVAVFRAPLEGYRGLIQGMCKNSITVSISPEVPFLGGLVKRALLSGVYGRAAPDFWKLPHSSSVVVYSSS